MSGRIAPLHATSLAIQEAVLKEKSETLPYTIDSWSSYSAQYHPSNILVDDPTEQSSRWSSGSNNQMQFITLKLSKPSIVRYITFGKYYKVHVCNIREFKVYGGLSKENMIELLHSGLRNDPEPETLSLKHKTNGAVFPCQYIKIVPLMAWGPNFNFSIWYVRLSGISSAPVVEKVIKEFEELREKEAIRLCLKHLRQRNYMDVFNALQQKSGVSLEHELLTELHDVLVIKGDFVATEQVIKRASASHVFAHHVLNTEYQPVWNRISAVDANGEHSPNFPSMRGGHQMCIDSDAGLIYLLGGWDGQQELGDFWVYSLQSNQWTCLSHNTEADGGPCPRSCHKICLDEKNRKIYVIGRYIDVEEPDFHLSQCVSDFFCYDIQSSTWTKISSDTAEEGGPKLLYDHQLCFDPQHNQLYLYGGKYVHPRSFSAPAYGGMYMYDCAANTWTLLFDDNTPPPQCSSDSAAAAERSESSTHSQLKSRLGHSMLLDPTRRVLYIFAGQRNTDFLSDLHVYNLDARQSLELSKNTSKQNGPDAGFTQRGTIDTAAGEIHVFCGMARDKASSLEAFHNTFWIYNIAYDKWSRVYQTETGDSDRWAKVTSPEPCPRFAHQLVYNEKTRIHYLFGGNPGDAANPQRRLNDFWSLELVRPTETSLLRKCILLIRRQRYREMCLGGSFSETLNYLRTELAATVNHDDPQESAEFRSLTSALFSQRSASSLAVASGSLAPQPASVFELRSALFDALADYFPDSMRQPNANLLDMMSL